MSANPTEFFEVVTKVIDEGRAVDVVYMDFRKASNKVHYGRHIQKLKVHEIHGNCLDGKGDKGSAAQFPKNMTSLLPQFTWAPEANSNWLMSLHTDSGRKQKAVTSSMYREALTCRPPLPGIVIPLRLTSFQLDSAKGLKQHTIRPVQIIPSTSMMQLKALARMTSLDITNINGSSCRTDSHSLFTAGAH
eukprot:g36907.t1